MTFKDLAKRIATCYNSLPALVDALRDGFASVEGGGSGGAFMDPSKVIYSNFTFDEEAHSWIATEDCILTDNMIAPSEGKASFIQIDTKQVFASYSAIDNPFIYIKKGQTVTYRAKSGSALKAYGILS